MKILRLAILATALGALPAATLHADDTKVGKKAQAKVVDPVCGMTVDPKTSEKAVYQGKTYYFCARSEKAEFEKNPEKYAPKAKKK